jgi:hypothetical protein
LSPWLGYAWLFYWRHDTQQNDIQHNGIPNYIKNATLNIMTLDSGYYYVLVYS